MLIMLIVLNSCSMKSRIVSDTFCLMYEPPKKANKEIYNYADEIIKKMFENNIKTKEEKFAEYMINNSTANFAKFKEYCK